MIADTLILDPRTGEVLAEPGQDLDDEQLYRLELLGLSLWADYVARQSWATHKDWQEPLTYWKQTNGAAWVARFTGGLRLDWKRTGEIHVPFWTEVM